MTHTYWRNNIYSRAEATYVIISYFDNIQPFTTTNYSMDCDI